MRSQGQVRFIKVSSRVQMIGAGAVAALALTWLGSVTTMAVAQYLATRDRMELLDREARVTTAESRVSEYRDDLKGVASDLEKRQDFLEKVAEAHLGDLPADARAGETVSDSSGEAAKTVNKVSALLPEAAGLARIEARQLAFAESLTRAADRRATAAAEKIRKLGLNPGMMLASLDDRSAMGGPLISLSTGRGSLDQRFQRLGVSLARMDALERGLAGGAAYHAGLDFRGPIGAPIYAAAAGTVSFAGVRSGYGNCIEIDHGNGLMTRYAHMSGYRARAGQKVAAGQVVGLIGSTGRSTGPHLHFEVRINDRPLNPRPFLEAAAHVFQEPSHSSADER
jgi:murein DD-endopeptidase MepM/ murein hydrolase activator NlpD